MDSTPLTLLPLWSREEAHQQRWGPTIRGMVGSGLACCGFVLFRCVYGDDDAWARFLDTMKQCVRAHVQRDAVAGQAFARYVEPALAWTVIEDETTLANATKEQVRERFVAWRDEQLRDSARHVSVAQAGFYNDLPRFNYCLCVDQACLDSLGVYRAREDQLGVYEAGPPVTVALVASPWARPFASLADLQKQDKWLGWGAFSSRGQPSDDDEDDENDEEEVAEDEFLPIESSTSYDVGWMYIEVKSLVGTYDILHGGDKWEHYYLRPPLVYPRHQFRRPALDSL
ncbi:uncharacterized protein SPSK_03544 [Sporothrix schenckii 1099-18]|uniref:Uncharacterized protein n=1 Tax=Sporothrix schenckii 1099-18 TaxID=1397361 RepID=A0A0F2LWX4_SPOSC|nr:uncharacterized protein SPSK_03544 [Sporothrix schenckii 1099-18]KJR81947.1 hypothetical protein SPSK_03544 [Sporothrix schenckii 1099-18]